MATSRPSQSSVRRSTRFLIVASVAAVGLTFTSGTGVADPDATGSDTTAAAEPQTSAEAQQQIADLNHELEIVTEQYNDAVILLDQREQEAAVAQARLRDVQADVRTLDSEVRRIARGAYTGNAVASFTALMTSSSPQEFLDRVNTLDAIAGHNNSRARQLALAQLRAADAATAAEQAQAAATATASDIEGKTTWIEDQLVVLEDMLAQLTEEERQAALALAARHGATEDRGNDRASREGDRNEDEDVPPAPIAAPTQAAQIAVDTAYAQLGDPYVWGGDGPDSFDCSGLTMYSYAAAGIYLPHSSNMQSNIGAYVSRSALQPGDLVFYYSPVSHVAIYVGNGQVIHAPNSGSVVQIADVDMWGAYNHAQRVALP